MRKSLALLISLGLVGFAVDGALARGVVISGQHGEQEIRDKCGSAYQGSVDSYGCTVPCSGGSCSVTCDRKTASCKGNVPSRTSSGGKNYPGSIGGVLGGSMGSPPPKDKTPVNINGRAPKTGGASAAGGGGQTTTIQNRNVEHSESHRH